MATIRDVLHACPDVVKNVIEDQCNVLYQKVFEGEMECVGLRIEILNLRGRLGMLFYFVLCTCSELGTFGNIEFFQQ